MDNNNSGGGGSIFLAIVAVVIILALIGSCSGGGSSSSSKECPVCGRTYTNSDDKNSIAWRNMCERCYSNYKYSQDLKDELLKYEERYGD